MATETTVRIEDIMSTPLETISADETVKAAATQMQAQNINGIFVPGAQAGIITTTDIVDAVAAGKDLSTATVGDVMTSPVERVTTSLELGEAAAMMTTYDIKHLPVIDKHQDYVGMVSSTDITQALS